MSRPRVNRESIGDLSLGGDLLQLVRTTAEKLGLTDQEAVRHLLSTLIKPDLSGSIRENPVNFTPTPPSPQPEVAPPSRTPTHEGALGRDSFSCGIEEQEGTKRVLQSSTSIRTGRVGESEGERTQDQVLPEVHPEDCRCQSCNRRWTNSLPEPLLFPGAEPLPKKRKKRGTWTADNLAESRSIVEEIAAAARAKRTKPVPAAKLSLSEALAQVPEFAEFWTAYPKRQGGVDAFKAWQQTASSRPPLSSLLSALRRQVAGLWAGSEARFVPLAGTWLRGERWNDEVGGGAVVPMPAAARASPGVDLPALKRAVQAEVGGALGGRVSREELAEILDEMETINDEPSLRRWADEAVRR